MDTFFLFDATPELLNQHEAIRIEASVFKQQQAPDRNADIDIVQYLSDDLGAPSAPAMKLSAPSQASAPVAAAPLQTWGATVTHIVDGDTFDVVWDAGDEPPSWLLNRVRLAGVDTNETTLNESFSFEAKARLAELLPIGTHVTLKAQDIESNTLNRPVRHVFVGSTNVALTLIQEGLGLAVSYDFEPDYRAAYFSASEQAQVAEAGMWEPGASGGNPATWPDIEIIVNYDAEGDDAFHLNDEYIQIRNNGTTALDLSNWSARSSARLNGTTIEIPAGTFLAAGETYRIYVGSGVDTDNSQYLGLTEPLFDNVGDVVYLRDANLNIRATQLWPATITRGPEHSIVIDDVQYDAPGDDNFNPRGEWIKIRNAGHVTVDLTDWRLKDDGFDYIFKDGETLAPGEKLTIYIGSGTDSGSNRYWGESAGILNNIGGALHVWTPQSLEVDAFVWGNVTSVNEDPRGAIRLFVNFDAAGNDLTNPNGEWVSLENTSDSVINIGGYKLVSGSDVYVFAAGTKLAAHANLLVKVGSGVDTATSKFWGKSSGIFGNSGDYVKLVDTSAQTILRHDWPAVDQGITDYGLVIDAVNFDAPGNDATNANGEWIRIRNESMAEQNLRNWQILVGTNQLNSLADRPIAPGETVTIFIGKGTNTADTLFWGKTGGILNNDGSRAVQLLAPNREVIESHSWGSAVSVAPSVSAAIQMSINYDAVGIDPNNPNGEWVNLVNTSSGTISLKDYHLYTDGTTYAFDAGDTLAAGERMRVYRGTGTDSGLNRYANLSLNEFSNTEDEIILSRNLYGGVSDIFAYPTSGLLPVHGQFEIVNVNYDAIGNDDTNPNGEWIEIKNTGQGTANLRDWRVQYQVGTFFDFNTNLNVAAGATIKIYMGIGTNTATSLYWGNASGQLSNVSGTLLLQSQYRKTADSFVW